LLEGSKEDVRRGKCTKRRATVTGLGAYKVCRFPEMVMEGRLPERRLDETSLKTKKNMKEELKRKRKKNGKENGKKKDLH